MTRKPHITDPAAAAAAGRCILARDFPTAAYTARESHPRECAWCVYPVKRLVEWLGRFNEYVGYDADAGTYDSPAVKDFMSQPRKRQSELVMRAAYGDGQAELLEGIADV